jgi:hypothetical protein
MERVGQLLDGLVDSYRNGAGKEEILRQLQVIQAELTGHTMPAPLLPANGSGKISVILPFRPTSVEAAPTSGSVVGVPVEEERIVQVLQVDERELEAELEELRRSAELKNELSIKVRQAKMEWDDPLDEIPTLASHRDYLPKPPSPVEKQATPPLAEETPPIAPPATPVPQATVPTTPPTPSGHDLNEVIGKQESSLNERLRTVQSELSEKLKDAPLHDLRKAIGINDRYLYINELFNGNEAMFDRSLKTLNAFTVYSEAEFWMQRELRIKLGWKEDNVLVQQFIQLVRRRFS